MTVGCWALLAVGIGGLVSLETWAWLAHGRSAFGVALLAAGKVVAALIAMALILGVGYVILSGGAGSAAGEGCDDNYAGGCVPDTDHDVDCADVSSSNLDVVGTDVDGLDRDGDGIACEG